MAAYAIFVRESTTNAAELETYSELAPPTLKGQPVTVRALYGAFTVLEGRPLEGAVVLEFPSVEEARAWYESPAYQAAAAHRKAGATYSVFIVEGVPSV